MDRTRYEVAPSLLLHTKMVEGSRRLVASADESRPPLVIRDARVAWALGILPGIFDSETAMNEWRRHPRLAPIAGQLWQTLVDEALVVRVAEKSSRAKLWRKYSWAEAFVFQEATRSYPFLQMNEKTAFDRDDQRMEEYLREEPVPPLYLNVQTGHTLSLPKLHVGESASARLDELSAEQRRGVEGVGLLLDICFGERRRVRFKVQGEFLGKAVPSGGARHPTEAFFVALPGGPFEPGVYHYNVARHELAAVRVGDYRTQIERATFDLFRRYTETPVGVLVIASLWERAMWRYRDARSARAPFMDAGHALMAYRTVAKLLGFGYYASQKMQDDAVCELLKCDPLRLTPLYAGTLV